MRTIVLTLLAVLLMATMARADITTWMTYDRDTAGVRVGVADASNEVGLFGAWRPDPEQPPNIFGAYGLHNFSSIDVNNPLPIDWLPAIWKATPYAGGYITVDLADENRLTLGGPMAGLKLFDVLCLEYRYQLSDDSLEQYFPDGQSIFAIAIYKRW